MRHRIGWVVPGIKAGYRQHVLFVLAFCVGVSGFFSMAQALEPQWDTETYFKPLVDTSRQQPQPEPVSDQTSGMVLQGKAERQNSPSSSVQKPIMLQARVKTLQEAIATEQNVNWYAWYLACRQYMASTGGIKCPLGTPIKFYKNGKIEALSFDPVCRVWMSARAFPLPKNTQLDALILPVRQSAAPPASPEEIYSRVQSQEFK